jgi:beta-ureidopropionase / N-carbamoyl-L-amino-acid hydrolase
MQCRLTGQTLREAMQSLQIDPDDIARAERPAGAVRAVIELHIEQGPELESSGSQIGVVTAVAGNTRLPLRIRGQQAHSGAMPMHLRQDALCGAAEVLLRAEAAARRRTSPPVVVSAGYFHHEPRSIAIIPGVAEMTLDVRSVDAEAIDEVVEEIRREAINVAGTRRLEVDFEPTWGAPPARLDQEISAVIVEACEDVGVTWKELASGAGHDSMMLARRFPAGMVFVPSAGGISHAPDEFTSIEDLTAGAMVLCRSIGHLAE